MSVGLIILIIIAIISAIGIPTGLCVICKILGCRADMEPACFRVLFMFSIGVIVMLFGYYFTPEGKAEAFDNDAQYEALSKAEKEAIIVKVLEKSATNNGSETMARYQFRYDVGFEYVNHDGETVYDVKPKWMTISESEFRACSIGDLYDLANYRFVKEELDENGNTVYVKAY